MLYNKGHWIKKNMKKRVSNRIQSFDSSVFRDIFRKQLTLDNPVDLSVGTPEEKTANVVKQAGIDAILNDKTGYTPANGIPELREAMLTKLISENNLLTSYEKITVVPGLTTGLLLVYMSILDPGDEIITMDPGYPPYDQLADALGVTVMSVVTLPDFQLNIPAIEASITDKTRAIVINSPNNPTGTVYPESDLRRVAEIAERHGIYIISDEIYEHFVYEGKHFSVGSIYPDTISMYGFSKQHAMTGWRLGFISGPLDVIEAINELQQYAIFSSSAIAQHAAISALKLEKDLTPKYIKKRDLVLKTLREAGLQIEGASGSYYVFFKAPNDMTDIEFTELLLEHNLILVPGRAFSSRHGYVRLSYGAEYSEVKKGLDILTNVMDMLK